MGDLSRQFACSTARRNLHLVVDQVFSAGHAYARSFAEASRRRQAFTPTRGGSGRQAGGSDPFRSCLPSRCARAARPFCRSSGAGAVAAVERRRALRSGTNSRPVEGRPPPPVHEKCSCTSSKCAPTRGKERTTLCGFGAASCAALIDPYALGIGAGAPSAARGEAAVEAFRATSRSTDWQGEQRVAWQLPRTRRAWTRSVVGSSCRLRGSSKNLRSTRSR